MKLFSTRSAQHIASNLILPKGLCTIKQFHDGELYVRIDEDVVGEQAWVLAGMQAPAEHLLELFFLCDALIRSGAYINLFIIYFAYARQVISLPHEASSTAVISTTLKNLHAHSIQVIHPHSDLLHNFLDFNSIWPTDFFCNIAKDYDAIAAPDEGAHALAQKIAQATHKNFILLTKMHPKQEEVKIVSVKGKVKGQRILLVDDIISTGHTITRSAQALARLGAQSVSAAVTHGIFSPESFSLIDESSLEKVFVTNSIAQKFQHNKITVVDISQFIQNIIYYWLQTKQ